MGHEHSMSWGRDYEAARAAEDMRLYAIAGVECLHAYGRRRAFVASTASPHAEHGTRQV